MLEETLNQNNIFIENDSFDSINNLLIQKKYSSIFVLVDTNTNEYCCTTLLQHLVTDVAIEIIEIDAGEAQKNIETCVQLWDLLLNYGADKRSLIINLGGGVISDLGGFVAATFKRGIDFINIPTTLLGMIDASIGGKNGIDFGVLKNQIGTISQPEIIVIYPSFLKSLPYDQLLSGFAEMLKHALILDKNHWDELKNIKEINVANLEKYITKSIAIKLHITQIDPYEKAERKLLNFGHTIGHAIESYFLENNNYITHGHAIAIGIVLESYISLELKKLSKIEFLEIKKIINSFYEKIYFDIIMIEKIIDLLKYDKKNSHGKVKFTLIEKIGVGIFDVSIDNTLIYNTFNEYKKNKKKLT